MRPAVLTDPDWAERAVDAITRIALTQGRVTAEDLNRDGTLQQPESRQQVGQAFRTAHHRGLIMPTGFRASSDRSRRGGAVREWAPTPALVASWPKAVAR